MIRFALPFTVLTLGLGALVLNGRVILLVAAIDAGLRDRRAWSTAIIVALGLTLSPRW